MGVGVIDCNGFFCFEIDLKWEVCHTHMSMWYDCVNVQHNSNF